MAKKAFIIGINTLGLQYSDNDAHLMANCLELYKYEIFLSTEIENKYRIREEIDQVIDGCNKIDTMIFYFSGHGIISRGNLKLVLGNDTSKNENLLDIAEIINSLETCRAIDKVIILDCCHAGTAYAEWNPEISDSYRMFTASERLENAKELEEMKSSFMTYHFSKALTDAALEIADNENKIYVNPLYEYLKKKTLEHNNTPNSIKVPVPNLLGNLKSNFEICTISPKVKTIEKAYDKTFVDNLVATSRQLYLDGKIGGALNAVGEAYSIAPYNSDVIERYATVLFREINLEPIWNIIRNYEKSGKEKDDGILIVEGDLWRRERKYKKAVDVLLAIKDRKKYNVEYLTGVSYLFLFGQDKKSVNLMSALRHLRKASDYFPAHWWIKFNLAFTLMLCGIRDEKIEQETLRLLNNVIEVNPGKISAKFYRLHFYALVDDYDNFVALAEHDNAPVSKQYELPINLVDSIQDRLDLLYETNTQKKEKYMSVFIKWATYFS